MFELQSPDIPLSSTWSEVAGPQNISISKQEYQMDEEDIFQVDKSDLIQGPTLAELNGDNLYVDLLNIDEIIAAEQMSPTSTTLTQLEVSPHLNPSNTMTNNANAMQPCSPIVPIQIFSQPTPQTPNNSLQSNPGFYDQEQTSHISSSSYDQQLYQTTPTHSSMATNSTAEFSPGSHSSNSPITMNNSVTPPPNTFYHSQNSGNIGVVQHNPKYTTLHELLMKKDHAIQYREARRLGQSVPGGHRPAAVSPGSSGIGRKLLANLQPGTSRLSSSAPTHLGLEQIWQRREPRPHLLSTGNSWRCDFIVQPLNPDLSILGSLAEAGSTSSLSTGGVLSPEAPDFSQDEGYSDDDSDDNYDDYSSGNGKLFIIIASSIFVNNHYFVSYCLDSDNDTPSNSAGNSGAAGVSSSKAKRYFWQYNVQAKGPKGQRLVIKTQLEDPHVLNEITDPVFSPNCSVRGIKVRFVNYLSVFLISNHYIFYNYSIVARRVKVTVMTLLQTRKS